MLRASFGYIKTIVSLLTVLVLAVKKSGDNNKDLLAYLYC